MAGDQNGKDLLADIITVISEHLGDDVPAGLNRETELESINIESIDMVEILFNIEDKYDINVPLEEVGGASTIGELADRLDSIIKSSQAA